VSLAVDHCNPPPWVVHVTFQQDGKELPVTWPFLDEASARAACSAAVASGQFTRTVRPASKARPAVTVPFVSLWRRADVLDRHGKPCLAYTQVDPEVSS
jgi:hypothetical protein